MPKLSGIFDYFSRIGEIPPDDIIRQLKIRPSLLELENFIANRILYPQVIPDTEADLEIDFALFKQALINNQLRSLPDANKLIDITNRVLYIPEVFLERLPNLFQLITVFDEAYLLPRAKKSVAEDIWTAVLNGKNSIVIGTVILPELDNTSGIVNINLDNKDYQIHQGTISVLPCQHNRGTIRYKIGNGKILGVSEGLIELSGGSAGIIIDARKGKNG